MTEPVNTCSGEPRRWTTGDAVMFVLGGVILEGTYKRVAGAWPAPGDNEHWSVVEIDVRQGRRFVTLPTAALWPSSRYCDAKLSVSWHAGGKVHCDLEPDHQHSNIREPLHHATVDGEEIWWRPTDVDDRQAVIADASTRRVRDNPQA